MAWLIHDEGDYEDKLEVEDGSPLIQPCRDLGVPFTCTEGICKTCVIRVIEGMENLSEYTEAEENLLGEMHDERLACQCRILQGTVKFDY